MIFRSIRSACSSTAASRCSTVAVSSTNFPLPYRTCVPTLEHGCDGVRWLAID